MKVDIGATQNKVGITGPTHAKVATPGTTPGQVATTIPPDNNAPPMPSTDPYVASTPGNYDLGGWGAPTIDFGGFNIPNYSGQIGELGEQGIQAGLQSLQELTFKPQYEQERGRLSSRGLVGSGTENQVLQDLSKMQGQQATDFVSGERREIEKQQLAEMQELRGLQMEAAFKSGDWQLATNIHMDDMKIKGEELRLTNEQLRIDVAKFNYSKEWDAFQGWIQNETLKLEEAKLDQGERGLDIEEQKLIIESRKVDIAELEVIGNQVAAQGYTDNKYYEELKDRAVDQGLGYLFGEEGEAGGSTGATGGAPGAGTYGAGSDTASNTGAGAEYFKSDFSGYANAREGTWANTDDLYAAGGVKQDGFMVIGGAYYAPTNKRPTAAFARQEPSDIAWVRLPTRQDGARPSQQEAWQYIMGQPKPWE